MEVRQYKEIEVPLSKWTLQFDKDHILEQSYQKVAKNKAYQHSIFIMKWTHPLLFIWLLLALFTYWRNDYRGKSESDTKGEKSNYIDIYTTPIIIIVSLLDIVLLKYIRKYEKFRAIPTIITLFYIIGEETVYVYEGEDMFSGLAIFATMFINYFGENISYSFISLGLGVLAGTIALIIRITIAGMDFSVNTWLAFIIAFFIVVLMAYSSDKKKRKKFFTLCYVKEKEEEWKRMLSTIPVGIAIIPYFFKNPDLFSSITSSVCSQSLPAEFKNLDVKYWNPALTRVLQNEDIMDEGIFEGRLTHRDGNSLTHRNPNILDSGINSEGTRNVKQFIHKILSNPPTPNNQNLQGCIHYEGRDLKLEQMEIVFEHKQSLGVIIEDVTSIKEAEREKLSREFQIRLVKTITHEIRTPLNAIEGSVDIMQNMSMETETKGKLEVYFKVIHNGIRFLLQFVECIMNLSKYKGEGKLEINKAPVRMRDLLEDMSALFHFEAERKGLKLETKISEDFPISIIQDRKAITQMIFILTSNALKYTFEGYIGIYIKWEEISKNVIIEVKDTGIGIPDSQKNELFQMYGSVIGMERENSEFGIGLGLTLIRVIVESMEGKITLESNEGEGTRVEVRVPATEATSPVDSPYHPNMKAGVPESMKSYNLGVPDITEGNDLNELTHTKVNCLSLFNTMMMMPLEEEEEDNREDNREGNRDLNHQIYIELESDTHNNNQEEMKITEFQELEIPRTLQPTDPDILPESPKTALKF